MKSKIAVLACIAGLWVALCSPAFAFKDHWSPNIDYLTCNEPVNPADQNIPNGKKWSATWDGTNFYHTLGPGTPGRAHPDTYIEYLAPNGSCWKATWDEKSQQFKHASATGEEHYDRVITTLTWDRSPWVGVRFADPKKGLGFLHSSLGDASYHPDLGQRLQKVLQDDRVFVAALAELEKIAESYFLKELTPPSPTPAPPTEAVAH